MRTATLYHGHVLDVLAGLPERSIQCSVTSPPYFGLRNYKLPPQIWAGDCTCEHQWDSIQRPRRSGGTQSSGLTYSGHGSSPEGVVRTITAQMIPPGSSAFCSACGAWRGSLGLEPTVQLYVQHIVQVCAAVWRVLRDDGTLWLNLGDSYASAGGAGLQGKRGQRFGRRHTQEPLVRHRAEGAGPKPKDLIGVPWRVALALQDAGWYLRSEIIWSKPAPMPESVRDRPTRAHEHVFLLSKGPKYFYDADAVREADKGTDHRHNVLAGQPSLDPSGGLMAPHRGLRTVNGRDGTGRNMRTVWEIGPEPCPDAHFATFPSEIPRRAILSGTSAGGCCGICGAPWVPIAVRIFLPQDDVSAARAVRGNGGTKGMDESSRWQGAPRGRTVTIKSGGWKPACQCGGEAVPCTVLDPFVGSGRSGVTALDLGRSFVGIDLSQTYLETIARPAIEAALQAQVGEDEPPVLHCLSAEQGSLW